MNGAARRARPAGGASHRSSGGPRAPGPRREPLGQLVRFAAVGLLHNAVGYALYLIVTWAGVGPKTTMSILYVVGTAISFVLNRNWSFRHDGTHGIALAKFVASYALGYLVNFCGLWLLVNRLGLPHQAVQAAMTLVVAALLFVLLRHFVFRTSAHGAGAEAGAA